MLLCIDGFSETPSFIYVINDTWMLLYIVNTVSDCSESTRKYRQLKNTRKYLKNNYMRSKKVEKKS